MTSELNEHIVTFAIPDGLYTIRYNVPGEADTFTMIELRRMDDEEFLRQCGIVRK